MNKIGDVTWIALCLLGALISLVVVAKITQGAGADAETQKALSYAVVGLVGGLLGAARRGGSDS